MVRSAWLALAPAALVLAAPGTTRAVPEGLNPRIYGMHDDPGDLLDGTDPTCARGWVTELRYIGVGGACGAGDLDFSGAAARGVGVIMRLDAGGSPPLPVDPAEYDGFAAAFADCVARSRGIRVWIVGNEPNISWGHVYEPAAYGEIYRRVLAAVDALPGGAEHEVLFAPVALWASVAPWGDWDDGLGAAIDHARAGGGRIDGLAIHAYTREFSVGAIASDAWFPGREGKWHLHFRIYRDHLALLAARGLTGIPLYITEAGNVCDPPCDPYPDADLGYFVAMYEEIDAWNRAHADQVIRAVTPYRWTLNDDGSGRDFCLGCSAPLRADLDRAFAMGRTWHPTTCREPWEGWPPDAGLPAGFDATTGGDAPPGTDAAGAPAADAPGAGPGGTDEGLVGSCGCGAGGRSRHEGPSIGTISLRLLGTISLLLLARVRGRRRQRAGAASGHTRRRPAGRVTR